MFECIGCVIWNELALWAVLQMLHNLEVDNILSIKVIYNMSFTTTYYTVSILADRLIDWVTPFISPICSQSFFGIAIYILPVYFHFNFHVTYSILVFY